tara:strand:+ start:62 stop:1870 length:1809 start_codon:yes stop_codon:yes gene_type:complete
MKKLIFLLYLTLLPDISLSNEVTIIELHNQSIDQLANDLLNNDTNSDNEENFESDTLSVESSELLEQIEQEGNIKKKENLGIDEISELPYMWENITKDNLIFLFENINKVNSKILRKELLEILNINSTIPVNFNKEDFNKAIIDTLITLGNRKQAYQIIQNLRNIENKNHEIFYREFELNYLLSTYKLSDTCSYKNQLKDINLINEYNFFSKLDIFCLALEEKFDEANLLNSLLNETDDKEDVYFQYLLNKLQNIDSGNLNFANEINLNNIFLYSAMHRIGNISLSEQFLTLDPINLSMPIILSSSTDIDLRLKAAHIAYYNKMISTDSLAALYQTVDFTYNELNDYSLILPKLNGNVEVGMAYFYQLINIQILPITRLEAILKFWDFAEKNNLELIAYEISIKNLNSIEPSNELAIYGPRIAKAYVYSNDYLNSEKWIIFSENFKEENSTDHLLASTKLFYNLNSIDNSGNFSDVLFDNLNLMNYDLINKDLEGFEIKNEILNLIFSTIGQDIKNPFILKKKIFENRFMPSLFLIDTIKEAVQNNNQNELILAISASIKDKYWYELHPEHMRLILIALKEYKQGNILNDIILEILQSYKLI